MVDRVVYNVRVVPELMGHPLMALMLDRMAAQVADDARSVAPFDEGDYLDSIAHDVIVEEGVTKGVVYSDDWKAMLIEFGTVDTPTFAPLRRGLEQLRGGI